MLARSVLLVLCVLIAACDAGAPADGEERPDIPLVVGRFDGTMESAAEDYTLRLYLEEDRPERDGAVIAGVGGAVYVGTAPIRVETTFGHREGDQVRFTAQLRSGGTVGFTGEVRDDGRTLVGMVVGETAVSRFGPAGIVLRWQDLNYR